MEKRKLITRRDALLLLCVLLAAAALFFLLDSRPAAVTAIVERDGETLLTQDLTALTAPREAVFTGAGGHTVTIRLEPAGASFTASTCPDQTCVRTGKITHAGEAALCLPARITLRLEGPRDAYDTVTY